MLNQYLAHQTKRPKKSDHATATHFISQSDVTLHHLLDKTQEKAKKWQKRENSSLGVYQYNPMHDVYEKISVYDELKTEIELLKTCQDLLHSNQVQQSENPYNSLKTLMRETFTRDEYHNKALKKLRKKLKQNKPKSHVCNIL